MARHAAGHATRRATWSARARRSRSRMPVSFVPAWALESDMTFRSGDSYTVKAFVPRPNLEQLADSVVGQRRPSEPRPQPHDPVRRSGRPDVYLGGTRCRACAERRGALPPFAPLGVPTPYAAFQTVTRSNDGDGVLRSSPVKYVGARAPPDASLRHAVPVPLVNRFLQQDFTYDETPDPVTPGGATSTASCSRRRAAIASTSPARWRCRCAWAGTHARRDRLLSPRRLLQAQAGVDRA